MDGTVEVWLRQNKKMFRASPDNSLFCARYTWDQRAESGYIKAIEDKSQILADGIENGGATVTAEESLAASRFFRLWQLRAEWKQNPLGEAPMSGVRARSGYEGSAGTTGMAGRDVRESRSHAVGEVHFGISNLQGNRSPVAAVNKCRWGMVTPTRVSFFFQSRLAIVARFRSRETGVWFTGTRTR